MRSADRLPGVAAGVKPNGLNLTSSSKTHSPAPLAPGEVNGCLPALANGDPRTMWKQS